MSLAIGYSFDKADIKRGAYYPHGYEDADTDNFEARKLWLQVLRNERGIRMNATMVPLPNEAAINQFIEMGELMRKLISGETTIPVTVQQPKSDATDNG